MSFVPQNVSDAALLAYVRPLTHIGVFPLPAGWKIVIGVVLFVLTAFLCRYFSTPCRRKRRVLRLFNDICKAYEKNGDVTALCADTSVLMRRVVLTVFKNQAPAPLMADVWLDFLEDTGARLTERSRYFLTNRAYAVSGGDESAHDVAAFKTEIRLWLKRVL